MLSCKKATELIEMQHEQKLALKDRLQLSLHLVMCKACKAYKNQSENINKALNQYFFNDKKQAIDVIKNEELKERIISKL